MSLYSSGMPRRISPLVWSPHGDDSLVKCFNDLTGDRQQLFAACG